MPILAHRDLGGTGLPPLVILHGMLGSSRNWQTVGRDLARHFHVLALDLRNHGDSFHAREMTYPVMAADVVAWMDGMGLQRVHLIGHSMGGKTAMRLAIDHPLRVGRLVVVDIAPKAYPHSHGLNFGAMNRLDTTALASRQQAEDLLAADVTDWAMRKFLLTNLDRNPHGPGFRWTINLAALTEALPTLEENSLAPGDRFDGDVLFVLGGKSRYFLAEDERATREFFPYVQFASLPQSGHNPHFDTRDEFVRIVSGFLGREGDGANVVR